MVETRAQRARAEQRATAQNQPVVATTPQARPATFTVLRSPINLGNLERQSTVVYTVPSATGLGTRLLWLREGDDVPDNAVPHPDPLYDQQTDTTASPQDNREGSLAPTEVMSESSFESEAEDMFDAMDVSPRQFPLVRQGARVLRRYTTPQNLFDDRVTRPPNAPRKSGKPAQPMLADDENWLMKSDDSSPIHSPAKPQQLNDHDHHQQERRGAEVDVVDRMDKPGSQNTLVINRRTGLKKLRVVDAGGQVWETDLMWTPVPSPRGPDSCTNYGMGSGESSISSGGGEYPSLNSTMLGFPRKMKMFAQPVPGVLGPRGTVVYED